MYLPQGTELNNRYVIESLLGHGGFGITYLGQDKLLNVRVAIKEYLPRQLATRSEGQTKVSVFTGEARQIFDYGLRKFLEEAQSVARFSNHPNIVSARDYFEANGTAYMVMEYADGVTLKEYLENKGGRISFEEAIGIIMPVMDALREIHQGGLLHRDISPDNIYITVGAQVRVIDFGAARYFAGEQSRSLSIILKPGYAPEEQYRSSGRQGAWTDVYAVGATLYKALTGQTPPDALDRMAKDTLTPPSKMGVNITPVAERALLKAMAVNSDRRFQTMGEFQQALKRGEPLTVGFQPATGTLQAAPKFQPASTAPPVSAYQPPISSQPAPASPQPLRRATTPAAIAAGIIAGVLAIIIVAILIIQVLSAPRTKEFLINLLVNYEQAKQRKADEQRLLEKKRQEAEKLRLLEKKQQAAEAQRLKEQQEAEKLRLLEKKQQEAEKLRLLEARKLRDQGKKYLDSNFLDQARMAFNKSMQLNPDRNLQFQLADDFYHLAMAYDKQGQFQLAIASLKDSVRLRPQSAIALQRLGLAYGKLKRYKDSAETLEKAVGLEPNRPYSHYCLGVAYLRSGNKLKAHKEYLILKRLDKNQAKSFKAMMDRR